MLKAATRIIFIEATQADNPMGYFYKALEPAWKEAAGTTGIDYQRKIDVSSLIVAQVLEQKLES